MMSKVASSIAHIHGESGGRTDRRSIMNASVTNTEINIITKSRVGD